MDDQRQPAARLRHEAEEFLLYPGQVLLLGRAAENDIVVLDPKVSRTHAELAWNGTGFTLRDLDSANGTYVNDQRLPATARLLRDGDELRFSKTIMVYELIRVAGFEVPLEVGGGTVTEPLMVPLSPRLVVSAGPDMGNQFPLWGERILIGRNSREATWEIRLSDRSVSRPHAQLERRADDYYLLDLDSANGTRLNGITIEAPNLLNDGDVIEIGETQLTFLLR